MEPPEGAIRHGRMEEFYALIAAGDDAGVRDILAREPDLAHTSRATPPPLHWAIYHDRPGIAELLLDAGADLGLRDPDRAATPLEYAAVYARMPIIRLLVAPGGGCEARTRSGAQRRGRAIRGVPGTAVAGGVRSRRRAPGRAPRNSVPPPGDRGLNR